MSFQENISVDAGADLSAQQYKAIAIGGTIAATPALAAGILQNKPKNGEDATLCIMGRSRFAAGAAVLTGALLTATTSGWFITAASGDAVIGRNVGAAVASGATGPKGFFNLASFTKID